MPNPTELKYTADHEWLRIEGDAAVVGITAFAAHALGDVVYLELPALGDTVTAGLPCGEIESTKSVSDFVAPVDGVVLEVNDLAMDDPGLVNSDPFGDGWLAKIRVIGELRLLDASEYEALLSGGAS